eukprot:Trichotokara_eunicae@DN1171_c0_g1_i1.p1
MEYFSNYDTELKSPASNSKDDAEVFENSSPMHIVAAPDVDLFGVVKSRWEVHDPRKDKIYTNPSIEAFKPVQGPLQPHELTADGRKKSNRSGVAEGTHISKSAFDTEYLSYMTKGVASDPSEFIASSKKRGPSTGGKTDTTVSLAFQCTDPIKGINLEPKVKWKRKTQNDPTAEDFTGPWAPYEWEDERKKELMAATEERRAKILEEVQTIKTDEAIAEAANTAALENAKEGGEA